MLAVSAHDVPRLQGPEPIVALGGAGMLGMAWTLPGLWARGINPIPPCLFHTLTGQPCPFCGGTRSFAAMAHGNVAAAARVFPIGPLLFLAVVVAVVYAIAALVTGRRIRFTVDPRLRRGLVVAAVLVLAANWASKLLILGY